MRNTKSSNLNQQDHGKKGVFMTLFSSVLFLFVIGSFLLFSLHGENIINFFKENTNIVAELNAEVNDQNHRDIALILQNNPKIKPQSVLFVSKNDALKTMQKVLGQNDLLNDNENPFRAVYTFNVKAKYANDIDLKALTRELSRQNYIEEVYVQSAYLGYWDTWKKKINRTVIIVGLILLIIAVSLIFNTIQLVIQSKKYAIHLMELIGASWSFIRFPFYRQSFKNAVISSSVACVLIGLSVILILTKYPSIANYLNPFYMIIALCTVLVTALIIHLGSTYYLLNKLLNDQ